MQDETAEIQVQQRTKEVVTSFYEEEGPDDEFRPVKISIVTTTRTQPTPEEEETRDEGVVDVFQQEDERENIYEADNETFNPKEALAEENQPEIEGIEVRHNSMEENGVVVEASNSPFSTSKQSDSDETRSFVSELSKSKTQESIETVDDHASTTNRNASLFDTSLLDHEVEDGRGNEEVDADDLSVVSKSVVDVSKKNVEEAEALAQEMKRQLAESLAGYSSTTSLEDVVKDIPFNSETKEGEQASQKEQELPSSSSSVSIHSNRSRSFKKSNSKVVRNASITFMDSSEVGSSEQRLELPIVNATPESASSSSVASSSSNDLSTSSPLRRHSFRHRRPSTASWSGADAAAYNDGSVHRAVNRLPVTMQQRHILESVVIPIVFLIAAVAICKTFFDPWLRVGNGNSNTWALTWTLLCIMAVVVPVCALEYLLLGGLLAGTVVKEALNKYPEVKRFLRDVRRMRLKAGWWYPSEVRTLRRDLEASNAELLSKQESELNQRVARDWEEDDARSIRRQMSREEHRKEKAQLEKIFDVERSAWLAAKEDLVGDVVKQKEESANLREQLQTERQKRAQIAAQKEQLENNIEVERAQWKYSRVSLEEALKTAVDAQKDNATSKDFFAKMERAQVEERMLWEKEREGFQLTIRKAQEDALQLIQIYEGKIRLLDEMRVAKQSQWEAERQSLKENVKKAINEAKEVKDALDSQLCKLMDANDEKYEKEIEKITEKFIVQKEALEQTLEDTKGEQEVSLRCVQNLQSLLEEERAEWRIERDTLTKTVESTKAKLAETTQRLERTELEFEEERSTRETARMAFEEALETAIQDNGNSSTGNEMHRVKSLHDELKMKESKIKALEESVAQLENVIMVDERIELSTNGTTQKKSNTSKKHRRHQTANREANNKLEPVAYIIPLDGVEVKLQSSLSSSSASVELSSSKDSTADVDTDYSSSYYSWVQKIQQTHNRELKQLHKGMLKQHVRWQNANHHVGQLLATSQAMLEASSFASEDAEGADNFHNTIVTYTAASVSAKNYMEHLVNLTGHEDLLEVRPVPSLVASSFDSGSFNEEATVIDSSLRSNRSIAVVTNPWLKNAPLWQQVWSSFLMAKMSPFRLCTTALRSVCFGIFGGGAFGMLHQRKSANSIEKTKAQGLPPATTETPSEGYQ